MATVIDSSKVDWDSLKSRAKFPWDEWTNGKAYQAVEGEDFQSNPNVFVAQLRKRAEKGSDKVQTAIQREKDKPARVIFQFVSE